MIPHSWGGGGGGGGGAVDGLNERVKPCAILCSFFINRN